MGIKERPNLPSNYPKLETLKKPQIANKTKEMKRQAPNFDEVALVMGSLTFAAHCVSN